MLANLWWIWFVVAVIFIVGEVFTMSFFLLWFGIGALVASAFTFFSFGITLQWSAFIIVSLVLFLLSRRFADKVSGTSQAGVGADRVINAEGIVTEEINMDKETGIVRIGGETWRAKSENGEIIGNDEKITVIKVEGAKVIVRR